ncbi:GntR family transcriptional regulator [Paracoccus sulfuroxidans]|uniref:DNA-binding GntR family transcriptional regulator n=1 Tax=Paracoccus sulfuroxidans TaxID=384678 RepID=A0A562NHG5_9RHOB|nr:GntR family transcriptional regulator [Paracoccus sulfuroxidans]TWI31544.1 DNA-binding GntR family transcriptional regulator [Paracoccus sulfuroxidans]
MTIANAKIEGKSTDVPLRTMVYRTLRDRLVTGTIKPDQVMSSRSLARELGVSPMPVREAISRLAAERALEVKSQSSVIVPAMTPRRFEDLLFSRLQLEPAAAVRALPAVTDELIEDLFEIDQRMNRGLDSGDVASYMSGNHEFHFKLYGALPAPTLMQLIETLWLQFGPLMRLVFELYADDQHEEDKHPIILQALRDRDAKRLHDAVEADIRDGMNLVRASKNFS